MNEETNHPTELAEAIFAVDIDGHFYIVGDRIDARNVGKECNRRGIALADAEKRIAALETGWANSHRAEEQLGDARVRIAELEAELADRDARSVQPAPADLPSDEALAERLHDAYEDSLPELYRTYPWHKLSSDSEQRNGRIAQARAATEMLAPWLREKATEPDTDTLDELARLAYETLHGQSVNVADWECMVSPINRARWRNAVSAVLRAAKHCQTRVRKALEGE